MLSTQRHELKTEVAEEAARDPNSSVAAEDAERVIVEESRKAGAAAFTFDANASPAEKAAQAQSRTDAPFVERKPKGVGLATDIDDGTPDQYDLPPPDKSSVVPLDPADENSKSANGVIADGEWDPAQVGWAPRFGTGQSTGEDGATLLDHQTFLESKLDDKFFGDWYHNTGVIIFACLASWVVAVLGGGLGWVFIVMATCGTYYRTSIRRVRRNFRDDISREMAKARLETDSESLEWMNSFLVKFWPIFAPNLAKTIIASVDQVLSTSTPAFLDSMRMKTFTLGTKPPRMEFVKTYPKAEDDTVLMEWKFSFTPTDTMDLTARQLKNKINPKVVLEVRVGKAMISKGLDIIVEDFAFSGLMRVKIKLQLPPPHVEKIDICFVGRPEIDYVCKPLGGETLGFDINFIPGLESFITEQIHGNLAPIMYDPNVFPIEIAKMLSGNPIDLAIGVVAVTIHGAQGLKNTDKFAGTPDPYVVVSLNSRNDLGRTKTIHENANPKWNETLYIIITNFTEELTLQVYDFNDYRKDKELGTAIFALDKLEHEDQHENLQLEVLVSGKNRGLIQADVRFYKVLEAEKGPSGEEQPPPESNTGIARITCEQAKDLDGSKSLIGQLNPYAVLLLNGKEIHITNKLKRTNNPIFNNPTKSVLITDRKKARIGLVIKDDRDIATDPVIGTHQIKLDDMLSLMENGQEWFNLSGTKTGRVKLSLDWKPVDIRGIAGGSGGYITPIGVMRVHLKSAQDLINLETIGKSDPYGRVLLSGIEKGRTVTYQNNLNPDWDEVIYVPMHSMTERLTLEVMDEEKFGKDRSLGMFEILASDFIHESSEGGYEVHDKKALTSGSLRMSNRAQPKGKLKYTISFYPTLNVIDPEEEEEERKALAEAEGKKSSDSKRPSVPGKTSLDKGRESSETRTSLENVPRAETDAKPRGSLDSSLAHSLVNGEKGGDDTSRTSFVSAKRLPKIRIGPDDLSSYESGLLVFDIIEGSFAHSGCKLEVWIDAMAFPSYISSKARSRTHQFGETGDAFIREIDMSRITLHLTQKDDNKGEENSDHVIAKLQGPTLTTLQQCLYKPTELTMKGTDGAASKIVVRLRYLPVKMMLDPSESINNSGTLRVDVLDAADLPSADRNGYSDPFCKFRLNGKDVFKTKVQKKTLHPAWNEYFEVPVPSRTAADFKCDVYDWDFGDKNDFLGSAAFQLEELKPFQPSEMSCMLDGKSGVLRLKMLFKPDYVTRQRQGSSTFSGTFAPAGKVVGAPVKGVGIVGGVVGGGVVKGASFLKRGFGGRNKGSRDDTVAANGDAEPVAEGESAPVDVTPQTTPMRAAGIMDGAYSSPPTSMPVTPQHSRPRSLGGSSHMGISKGAETGTANFTIISATDYPASADVRVLIKMMGPRGSREVHKTKSVKSSSGKIEYSADHDSFKVPCSEDTQFQILVQDHGLFKTETLGEALFVVSNQGTGGGEKMVKVGDGSVQLRSSFAAMTGSGADSLKPNSGRDSPDSKRGVRRSFMARRDVSGKH